MVTKTGFKGALTKDITERALFNKSKNQPTS